MSEPGEVGQGPGGRQRPMQLRLMVPGRTVVRADALRVVAESPEGSFGILPRHIDVVSALAPGILLYEEPAGGERLVAVDLGLLLKRGPEVLVSVRDAVPGAELESLRATVRERFQRMDDRERRARSALAELEAQFIRRFLEERGGSVP